MTAGQNGIYSIDDLDTVELLENAPLCDTGAPLPVLVAGENDLLLSYRRRGSEVAVVRFVRPRLHLFGPPSDEALHKHPLKARGLDYYGAFVVRNSSLMRRMERLNSVYPKLSHYVFTFHDSTFECVAESFTASIERVGPMSEREHWKWLSDRVGPRD